MEDKFSEIFKSRGINYYTYDLPLQDILTFFCIKKSSELKDLGLYVSEELIEIMDYVDHKGKPELLTWNIDGKRIDYVKISPEHRRALKTLQNFGTIEKSVSGKETWMYHFISGYLISDSGIFCTLTLTAQTAYALKKYYHGNEKFLQNYLDRANPWYGATFYTEIQGGSDLGSNKTVATKIDGEWTLTGPDKYFASNAGIADGAIVTAKVGDGGVKSIGTFFVPYVKKNGDLNFLIRRLKNKLGTVAVPSGEVEFNNSEAYLLGEEKNGIYYAMEILSISRVDDALAAVGIARKAFWEAFLFTLRREAFGKKLIEHPLMRRDVLTIEAKLEASLAISLYSANLFSQVTEEVPPYDQKYHYARFITHIAKNMAAWTSTAVTQYSMEMLGGIGFLEEFPVAKFHRDALVTSIWEGTSNIQALEMLEAILKKKTSLTFFEDLHKRAQNIMESELKDRINQHINDVKEYFDVFLKGTELEGNSKELLRIFGEILSLTLLAEIGSIQSNDRMIQVAEIYEFITYKPNQISPDRMFNDIKTVKWMLEGGH
jgi:acyl-CoA dehydrogenase